MLPLLDPQVRLVLLTHVAVGLRDGDSNQIHSSGIDADQLQRLRELSPLDLNRLAVMRELRIAVRFDGADLKAGLRALRLVKEAKNLEAYFIRNGASWQMMNALFKISRKTTQKRRRDCGAWRPAGRIPLPNPAIRERIFRAWLAIKDPDPRGRYFQLHHLFPGASIAVLEAVVREFEADA